MASKEDAAPDTPQSLIKDEHVEATLKADKGSEAHLVSWKVEDFTQKGDNYATVVTSVIVKFTLKGRQESVSYVVKLHRELLTSLFSDFCPVIFKKEAGFYTELAPLLTSKLTAVGLDELRVPRCLYKSLNENSEMIFFEDLRTRGFKMYDRKKGMDVAHARLVLQELARLHAASILLQRSRPDQDLAEEYDFLKLDWINHAENAEKDFNFLFSHTLSNAKELLEKIGGYEVVEEWLDKHKANSSEVLKRHLIRTPPFEVICHGDCWNNNIVFRYDEDGVPVEVMLLDLQLTRYASPATDLNYFLYTSFNGDVRQANVQEFLKTYYDTFSGVLEAGEAAMPFTHTELLQEYKNKHEYGLLFSTMALTVVISEPNDIPDMDNVKEEDLPNFLEEWRMCCLNMLDKNPLVRPRFLSIFDEMIEFGVFR